MHGTAYVRSHLQGQTTGCYVDQSKLKIHEDTPITSYYLWLPYLLSLLYALAKLPQSLWKRYFENNLISSIIGGIAGGEQGKDVTNGDTNTVGGNEEGEGEGDGKRGQNQNQQQGKKKGNQNNNNKYDTNRNFGSSATYLVRSLHLLYGKMVSMSLLQVSA